jgi:regulator of RNase E activity RraA
MSERSWEVSEDVQVIGTGEGRVTLPQVGPPFDRATAEMRDVFANVSAATASATLHKMGIRRSFVNGPKALTPGGRAVGSAVTLSFMPAREDMARVAGEEQYEKRTALWAVMEEIEQFDILVVQAFGDPFIGCLGEMLTGYIQRRGAAGIVLDGYIRDWPHVKDLGIPIWARGTTPHFGTQGDLIPWGYHQPIACGGVLVLPGDLVVADDDGAVVVPQQLATTTARIATTREEWEVFSRKRIAEGGKLSTYYPLAPEARAEFEEWQRQETSGEQLAAGAQQ